MLKEGQGSIIISIDKRVINHVFKLSFSQLLEKNSFVAPSYTCIMVDLS